MDNVKLGQWVRVKWEDTEEEEWVIVVSNKYAEMKDTYGKNHLKIIRVGRDSSPDFEFISVREEHIVEVGPLAKM